MVGPWNLSGMVIDSGFQEQFMEAFWCGVAGILGTVLLASITACHPHGTPSHKRPGGLAWRILTWTAMAFVLGEDGRGHP